VAVSVPLPPGTRQVILKTDPTADGASHDQGDWADAVVELADGTVCRADDERPGLLERALPFSFLYGGQPSAGLLADWTQSHANTDTATRRIHRAAWQDPKTGLRVTAEVTVFKPYAAVEWVLHFENTGAQDTPMLANLQALDTRVRTGYARKPLKLHQIIGDQVNERSFLPFETILEPGKPALAFRPVGGRSSNHTFPFFNLQYGGDEGLMVAVGWSGQWAATLERSAAGPTHLTAGMEKTRLQLRPGERIRTPRILLLPWKGDLQASHNRLRRLLLFEYAPRQDGRPTQLPVALQCFDRYSWTVPDFGSEAGQLRAARATRDFGFNTHWLDAAWFEGGFPNGVGNWFCKPKAFPAGLKPVGDACHQMGLKFLVWFEPERVAPGTQIAREHPEFVFGGAKGGLFNLGNAQARQWLIDLVAQRIKEFGIDCYRNDFNLDPLASWNGADATNRQGMAEIRYVEGHYAFWDELRRRTPGLFIDNCASGGRRIDLETCARAVPLWRSDTCCQPGRADWDQNQTLGLGRFVPLFASCAWEPKAYVLRSAASAGIICQFDYLNEKFPADEARRAVAEARGNRKYWYGDFYPLTSAGLTAEAWAAWQLHRADLDAGIVLAFRREDSPFPVMQTALRALKPSGRYRVVFIDEERREQETTLSGQALMNEFELRIPQRRASLLVRYRPE
jgi:alpha-galactosidase